MNQDELIPERLWHMTNEGAALVIVEEGLLMGSFFCEKLDNCARYLSFRLIGTEGPIKMIAIEVATDGLDVEPSLDDTLPVIDGDAWVITEHVPVDSILGFYEVTIALPPTEADHE